MNHVNRGYISIRPTKLFFEWAMQHDSLISFKESDYIEPNIYLITEDFLDEEPVLKQHFKKIFENELMAITDDDVWPETRTLEVFLQWFNVEFGSMVFDLEKSDLKREEI